MNCPLGGGLKTEPQVTQTSSKLQQRMTFEPLISLIPPSKSWNCSDISIVIL